MDEYGYIYAITGVMVLYFIIHVATKRFDPFAPVWLFFVGFAQIYVIQALSYHDWAVRVRGEELVTAANFRALWALLWFLAVYHFGPGRAFARSLPAAPREWSTLAACALAPVLFVWGMYCTSLMGEPPTTAEDALLRSFPFVMMVSAVLLIVTGRRLEAPNRPLLLAGLAIAMLYILIWMFNGKRSHSLIGVLATVCAFYIARLKRPSWTVLAVTAFLGVLVVALAIDWRGNQNYDRSFSGFSQYLGDFEISRILISMNVTEDENQEEAESHETKEYGGFLLMLDTVPERSEYDYGQNYLRTFSTYIPRLVWPNKPLYGRKQWIDAWIAGSELDRSDNFTSPAIGILGATQLNGGALGTLIVLGVVAMALRCAYDYFRLYAESTWAQFFWAISFFNAWFMVVGDDPMTWFYYNWGFASLPTVVILWLVNRGTSAARPAPSQAETAAALGPFPAVAPGRATTAFDSIQEGSEDEHIHEYGQRHRIATARPGAVDVL